LRLPEFMRFWLTDEDEKLRTFLPAASSFKPRHALGRTPALPIYVAFILLSIFGALFRLHYFFFTTRVEPLGSTMESCTLHTSGDGGNPSPEKRDIVCRRIYFTFYSIWLVVYLFLQSVNLHFPKFDYRSIQF